MFEFIKMMGNYEDRKVDRWDSDDELKMISTAAVNDGSKPFETAVQHPAYNNGLVVIVESYDSKEDAQKGHDRWLNLMLTNKLPNALVDCGNAKIAQLIDLVGGDMAFERQTDE